MTPIRLCSFLLVVLAMVVTGPVPLWAEGTNEEGAMDAVVPEPSLSSSLSSLAADIEAIETLSTLPVEARSLSLSGALERALAENLHLRLRAFARPKLRRSRAGRLRRGA